MPIYMNYDGIKGDVTEDGHKDWIELNSLQFGCGRSIGGTASGAAKGREASTASISEISVTKPYDSASQDIMKEAMMGAVPGKLVKIELTRTGPGNQPIVHTSFELEECMISGFSYSSGGDTPMESLSLNFTKIQYSLSKQETDATTGNPKIGYFDLRTAKGG